MPQPPSTTTFESQRSRMITLVDQLRIHYKIDRMRVSQTTSDMIEYCQQNINNDPLIYPIKENPFKEKKSCTIL